MKFSQRIGKTPIRDTLQIESIDTILRNHLWSCINYTFDWIEDNSYKLNFKYNHLLHYIWINYFNQSNDTYPDESGNSVAKKIENYIRKCHFESEWYEVYDFIEFLSKICNQVYSGEFDFDEKLNNILLREKSAYRLINNQITPIIDGIEISTIEEAIGSEFESIQTHLETSLGFLSNRQNPDYRNSIKEAISAVEAMCKIIVRNEKVTLGDALSSIEKRFQLHKALKSSFSNLYGFTSDAGGIRHSLLEDDVNITFEDAKYVLVSCSAFINYLKQFYE